MNQNQPLGEYERMVKQSLRRGCLVMLGFLVLVTLAMIGLWQVIMWIVR